MNAGLHMAEDLKNTAKGNLSVIFGNLFNVWADTLQLSLSF